METANRPDDRPISDSEAKEEEFKGIEDAEVRPISPEESSKTIKELDFLEKDPLECIPLAQTLKTEQQQLKPLVTPNSSMSCSDGDKEIGIHSESEQPVYSSSESTFPSHSFISIPHSSSPSLVTPLPSFNSPSASVIPGINPLSSSKAVVPPDMMPTIPLVPVQVPVGRGGIVNLASRMRGRPRGTFGNQYSALHSSFGIAMRSRGAGLGKLKRLGSNLVRGGRRLVHSMSLDDKGALSLQEDSPFTTDDEVQYSQDDMFVAPTSYQEKWPDKTCAFCCLSELSQLGQGDIIRYDPTPGFNLPEKAHFTEDVLREASAAKKLKLSQFKDKAKSPRKQMGDHPQDQIDEMLIIGHTERPSLAILFNTTGQCFAHYACAQWSSGVEMASDDTIACVDKAVVSASEIRCSYCKRLGASINCAVPECETWLHFPCATASGASMDLKSLAMVCPSHISRSKEFLVDLACMVCEQTSPEDSLLFCCTCGNHYHGQCLKASLTVSPTVRAGWQCADCKICQICRLPGDEIVCDVCDKSYHSVCARPQGLTHTRIDWKCKSCRVCGDCGSRIPGNGLSSKWHSNFTVCDSCYQLRNKGFACPVCKKAYRAIMQRSLAQCSICRRHVHNACDSEADLALIKGKRQLDSSYEFICVACRNNPTARWQSGQQLLLRSPEREDSLGDLSHDTSMNSEDSNDTEIISDHDSLVSPVKPFSSSISLPTLTSSTSITPTYGGSSMSSSSIALPTLSSTFTRGKPFGLARRGMLFPRMRGSANKFTYGKKGVSCRKRGTASTIPTARKGRGPVPTVGRGYRGYFNYQPVTLQAFEGNHGGSGKEEGEENKFILVSTNDKFSLWQDVCAMCGTFGQDQEGKLIACSQCGQCYHPYCANVKVNRVVLEKGWRCLDCTVCEGCGERNDEARLVLCEDCDISCHIYCMTPPLEQVPAGIWKCKWCAVCQYCGSTDAGRNSTWQQNYSMCGPCYSMTTCPVCDEPYAESELIIQCGNCDRWLHASDDMICTEDEAEKCIGKGYLCLLCRPTDSLPPHLHPQSPPHSSVKMSTNLSTNIDTSSNGFSIHSSNHAFSPTRSESPIDFLSKINSNTHHWMDGTCLSESGLHQIQNMTLQPMKKPRNLKGLRSSRGPSLDSTGSRDIDEDDDDDEDKLESVSGPQHWVYGMKEGTLLNAKEHGDPPILPEGFYTLPGPEPGTFILRKRRYRNIKTVGIGGFHVRARARKEEEKAREEAEMDPQALELRRKRSNWRTKKKIKILEKFPSYIQEAFFGRNLMDTSNLEVEKQHVEHMDTHPIEESISVRPSIRLSQDEADLVHEAKEKHELAKKQKLESYMVPAVEQTLPRVHSLQKIPSQLTLPPYVKVEGVSHSSAPTAPPTASIPVAPKSDEKKKDEKVVDIVEDDENNDAIEALFGGGGSALISDDLVRDIIKDEETTFQGSDRDQIDTETAAEAAGKLTDLLGPGFNLDDVADIMKNLREETTEEGGNQESSAGIIPNPNRGVGSVIPEAASMSVVAPYHCQRPTSSIGPMASHVTPPVVPAPLPLINRPTLLRPNQVGNSVRQNQLGSALTRPNQLAMAPFMGSPIPGTMKESQVISSQLKQPNVTLQTPVARGPGLPFNSPAATADSYISEEGHQKSHVPLPYMEYNAGVAAPAVSPNVSPMQVPQSLPKQPGQLLGQHSPKRVPQHQPVLQQQRIAYPQLNSAVSVSNHSIGPISSVVQPPTPIGIQGHHVPAESMTTSPSHQQSPVGYHYPSNEQPNGSSMQTLRHSEVTTKSWTSTSENQSLSLTLEEDEALGPKATKAAVLYTNINKPTLKTDVALIQDREKQIKRIWKNLDAEQRKIYAQRARENKKEYFKNKQLRSSRVNIPPSQTNPVQETTLSNSPTSPSPTTSSSPFLESSETSQSSPGVSTTIPHSSSIQVASSGVCQPGGGRTDSRYTGNDSCTSNMWKQRSFLTATENITVSLQSSEKALASRSSSSPQDSLASCLSSLPSSLSLFPTSGHLTRNSSTKLDTVGAVKATMNVVSFSANSQKSPMSPVSHCSSRSDGSNNIGSASSPPSSSRILDQPIRVLTPLEIMRTLPILQHQDGSISFPGSSGSSPDTSSHSSNSPPSSSPSSSCSSSSSSSTSIPCTISSNMYSNISETNTFTAATTVTTSSAVSSAIVSSSAAEQQRALKSQEKDATAVASSGGDLKGGNGVQSLPNIPYSQVVPQGLTLSPNQGTHYIQGPPRPHSEQYAVQQPRHPLMMHRPGLQQLQQGKWGEDGNTIPVQQPHPTPTRPLGQFRPPLPPIGLGQQMRMRMPSAQPPQMRLILQQQHHMQNQPQQQVGLPSQVQQHPAQAMHQHPAQAMHQHPLHVRSLQHQQSVKQSQLDMLPQREGLDNFSAFPYPQEQLRSAVPSGNQNYGIRPEQHIMPPSPSSGPLGSQSPLQQMQNPHPTQQAQQMSTQYHQSVARELDQLEKEPVQNCGQKPPGAAGVLEMETGGDLSQMEDELLSGIRDFKDLLDFADQRISNVECTKLPSNLFDNLDEDNDGNKTQHVMHQMPSDMQRHPGFLASSTPMSASNVPPLPHAISHPPMASTMGSPVMQGPSSSIGTSPMVGHSPSMSQSPTLAPSSVGPPIPMEHSTSIGPILGPSPVHIGVPGHSSPILVGQGPSSGPTSAPGTPGTPGSYPGSHSPATPGQLNEVVPLGPSSGPVMGSNRMVVTGVTRPSSQGHMQNPSGIMSQMPMHIHQQNQGFINRMQPGVQQIIRQHHMQGHVPPPPPPYPGPPSYPRPQVIPGEGVIVRSPLGSPLGGGVPPPLMHPHSHSPVMGNPPLMMGPVPHPQHMAPHIPRRTLLLQEQPLLIEDIIEEEKREQMKQQKAIIGQSHPPQQQLGEGNSAIRPQYQCLPNSPMGARPSYPSPVPSPSMNRPVRPPPPVDPGLHPALLQAGSRPPSVSSHMNFTVKTLPPPPQPPDSPQTESDFQTQQQYENWLTQQNNLIISQQKYFDTEITKLRRQRKSLNSKQRTLKKNGQELCERDAAELDRIQKEASAIQRQLDVCRKSSRQHSMLITEYNNKKRQRQAQLMQSPSPTGVMSSPQTPLVGGSSPMGQSGSSPINSTPQSPLMTHSPQQAMGMSPMVHSPHTPVASPSATMPQHSPHGMMVPGPLPSPGDIGGPFSPQARMPSPGTPPTYAQNHSMVHPRMAPQGIRVRMSAISPGVPISQPAQMSPHTMVVRQNYPSVSGQMTQSVGQQMVMRHQYSPNVIPMRRPSGSGPVQSPGPVACPSPVGHPQSPLSSVSMKPSPLCPSPSPIPCMATKPSPVHGGLRSPNPVMSPQMRQVAENQVVNITPRGNEMTSNPMTPYNEPGCYGSQVSSPHNPIQTSSPSFCPPTPGGCFMDSSLGPMQQHSSLGPMQQQSCIGELNRGGFGFGGGGNVSGDPSQLGNRNEGGGGGGGNWAPIPFLAHDFPRQGILKFGLKGGFGIRSRWGHFRIGLKGGQPSPMEKQPDEVTNRGVATTALTTTSSPVVVTSAELISYLPPVASLSDFSRRAVIPEEGLAGVLSDSIKGRMSRSSALTGTSHASYVSAGCTAASTSAQFATSANKIVVPEPPKSDIPPSSRHHSVIGIPGGGAICSQALIGSSRTIGVAPGVKISAESSSLTNFSSAYSGSGVNVVNSSTGATNIFDNLKNISLVSAPIMSLATTSSVGTPSLLSKPNLSLAQDVNTLATVVSASSQVSNVLGSSRQLDLIHSMPHTMAVPFSANQTRPLGITHPSVLNASNVEIEPGAMPDAVIMSSQTLNAPEAYSISNNEAATSSNANASMAVIPSNGNSNVPSYISQSVSHPISTTPMTVFTRQTMPHTLHHLPQQKMPMVLTASNQTIPSSLQATPNPVVSSTRIMGTTIHQHQGNVVVQSPLTGQSIQVVQSINQYGHVVQTSPSGQFIVQHQHQPTGVVFTNSGSQVRMVGQQVMMQQGLLRGSGVMVKSSPQVQGGVMVRSASPVQGGVRMMMIHNSQRTTTPPPAVTRQPSPLMPPPTAKSPASLSASPVPSRVSPAPSPIAQSPSPHSPQLKSQSPHQGSPVPSPQLSSTPPIPQIQRRDSEDDRLMKTSEINYVAANSGPLATTLASSKDAHVKDALLKQLLQKACSSNTMSSGQLVLVRSSPANLPSHLSRVASPQVPNASPAGTSRMLQDSVARGSANNIVGQNPVTIHATVIPRSVGLSQISRTTALVPQQGGVITGSEYQSVSGVQVVTHPISGTLHHSVVLSHPPTSNITTQVQPSQVQQVPSNHYVSLRQNQAVHSGVSAANQHLQTAAVTLPSSYVLNQLSQHPQNNLQRTPQPVQTLVQAAAAHALQNTQRMSPLTPNSNLREYCESGKPEMRALIPESVSSGGGDLNQELNTPTISCDDPEDAKKSKKRAQNQARRKSQVKDNKAQPAKRARQASRVEEDYDSYIEGMMAQLRVMPPLSIREPDIPRNFNLCPLYGAGDVSKLGKRDYNYQQGLLEGPEGSAIIKGTNDYYNTQPFGPMPPMVMPPKTGPTPRGFYNQEFTPPRIGLPADDCSAELEEACSNKGGTLLGRDADSPDTILSSSSPECVMPDSPLPFKGLRLVENDPRDEGRDRSLSPSIPLLVPIPLNLLEDKKFVGINAKDNKENLPDYFANISLKSKLGLTPSLPLKDLGNVTVSLTLSSHASQDISHVLRSLANLLNIPPPKSYNIADHTFDHIKIRKSFKYSFGKDGKEQLVDMQSIINGKVKFCKQCNTIVMQNFIWKKVSELPFLSKEEYDGVDDLAFCSKGCLVQFAIAHRVIIDEKSGMNFVPIDWRSKSKDNFPGDSSKSFSASGGDQRTEWRNEDGLDEVLKLPKLQENRRGLKHRFDEDDEYPRQEDGKRFRGHHYKFWSKDSYSLPDKYEKPTNKEMTDLLFGMRITYRLLRLPEDSRQCSLCPLYGDYLADGPSRLLNFDVDKWVHLNCTLWAEDVYETMSGSLVNVDVALKKAVNTVCVHCEQNGASIKCFKVRCNKMYHLNCAVKEGCTFYKNKTVYCPEHINKGDKENELSTLAVYRRVFVDRDENRQVASVMHHAEMNYVLRIGSLILLNIGQLLPHHLQAFHSPVCIYPIGYQVVRFYWSMRHLNKRCAYECSIQELDSQPEFRIIIKEEGYEDLVLSSRSPKGVWNKILEPIAEMRQKNDVVKLFPQYISGEDLFGLTEPAIVRILESMPGVDTLGDYNFKFGSNPLFELPLAVNPTGCARSEPFNKTHMKRHCGIRTSAGSVKSGSNNPRTAATIASLTMNFDPFTPFGKQHSRFFQYKKMKNEWRSVVYLARSKIQGLGLYAARDIERNTAIIEYIGEIIRAEVAEVREKRYEAQNRGVYMFRLDDSRVVDATATGGLARYINHSCGPNCFTETVEIEKDCKIIIVSNRKINRGEELAYDYKFDLEEDHKIPCLCGAENCRKWMN